MKLSNNDRYYGTGETVADSRDTRKTYFEKKKIIREQEKPRKSKGEDCCAGFLAGCAACLTISCLMGLCCPHGHRGPRGRW